MKLVKISLIVMAAVLISFGLSTYSYAFHSGGVAECDGCHTMHNSEDNAPMSTNSGLTQFHAGPYLLQGNSPSEACLNCHQHTGDTGPNSYHISTATVDMKPSTVDPSHTIALQRTPGGDFGWLRNTYAFTVRGTTTDTNEGYHRGHSIVAPAMGYDAQIDPAAAPGGGAQPYPAASLSCHSCHDPHPAYRITTTGTVGRQVGVTNLPIIGSGSYNSTALTQNPQTWGAVGVYRILGGPGYRPKSMGTTVPAFTEMPPVAVAPSTYNQSEATNQVRVSYGAGMSEWCSNCHPSMLQNSYTSGMSGLVHPAGYTMPDAININYNAYVKSGDMGGSSATSYLSLVPFEVGTTDRSVVAPLATNNQATSAGPSTGARVMCLSCHRAHASGFKFMLRYAHQNEFMTIADASGTPMYPTNYTTAAATSQGMTSDEIQAAYYDRAASKFAPYNRLLCNKCHAKD